GLQTSGYRACVTCGPRLNARRAPSLKKQIYEGHQAYLPENHVLRDGFLGREPPRMSAQAWLEQKEMCVDGLPPGMKRLSLWYELPYWPRLMINHLLDPMHIFKNVGNLLWDHLTDKKDTLGARVDLRNVDRMEQYWLQTASDGSIKLPKAPWIFTGAQERIVDEVEIAGTAHSRWMFFLERFMKTLKGYVRQKARPEGSMAEGWYIGEWLDGFDKSRNTLWRTIDDERISRIVMCNLGVEKKMTEDLEAKINRFCMLHNPVMQKWISQYEDAKQERQRA
ncbi:hypothetical protein GOP47_0012078, partial [Adiantum capillus-veneris]